MREGPLNAQAGPALRVNETAKQQSGDDAVDGVRPIYQVLGRTDTVDVCSLILMELNVSPPSKLDCKRSPLKFYLR